MRLRAERLGSLRFQQPESPRWDGRGDRLVWVDMANGDVLFGRLADADVTVEMTVHVGSSVGFVAPLPTEGDGWVCARERGFVHISDAGEMRVIAEGVAAPETQFNDGSCDAEGTLWAGTQSHRRMPDAGLFALSAAGQVRKRLAGVTVSNGLGFTADGSRMYYIDTLPSRSLDVFDVIGGELSNRRQLVSFDDGNPDGLAVDAEDGVWVAVWDAGEVRRFDRHGTLTHAVEVGARRPTSVCLVGSRLIIPTATLGLERPGEGDGHLFAVDVETPGHPTAPWRPEEHLLRSLRESHAHV